MTTRSLAHEIELPHRAERVFALLHTPSDVRAWWFAARVVIVPTAGGIWSAAWGENEDDPDYVTCARIAVFEPPRRLVLDRHFYYARGGSKTAIRAQVT
ncbi:MAG: SRPBCC domain-containing protein [Phycisphaerae bacterium]